MNFALLPLFILYQLLQIIFLPIILLVILIRKIKGKKTIGNLKERLGFVPKVKNNNVNIIWLHAVSVGEILSIQSLIVKIKEQIPNSTCYVTNGTITGNNIAKKTLPADYISFLPYDFLIPMLFAFKRIKANKLIIVEAETWPNLLILSKLFKIDSYLINARISKRSKNKYLKLKIIFKTLFNIFKIIFTQSNFDKKNFEQLGIQTDKLITLGNIKTFNVLAKKTKLQKDFPSEYYFNSIFPTLMVGSVHPGELDFYLNLFKTLKKNFSNLKLILAPRHFHWKSELIKKIEKLNTNYFLWDNKKEIDFSFIAKDTYKQNNILLVCKLGELFKLYQLCDIFYLGGTFVPIGGHNLLEPAIWHKPSIIGPHYQNCKDIADKLQEVNSLIKVKTQEELINKTKHLLQNKNLINEMGNNAYNWVLQNSQTVENNLEDLIEDLRE